MSSIAVDLTDDVKSRSASSAAAKLEHLSGDTMVHELMQLSPGLAQDVLAELPNEARERAIAAAPPIGGNFSSSSTTTNRPGRGSLA